MSHKFTPDLPQYLTSTGRDSFATELRTASKRCDFCGSRMAELPKKSKRHVQRYSCPGCETYSAAVSAQGAAAKRFAEQRHPPPAKIGRTWVNEYGFFAAIDGVHQQIGSAKEAAPFAALTTFAMNAGRIP